MKIFQINWHDGEKSWIAAKSNIQALQVYTDITLMELSEFEDNDEIIELDRGKWADHHITDGDEDDIGNDNYTTFEEWMLENDEPDIIAETI